MSVMGVMIITGTRSGDSASWDGIHCRRNFDALLVGQIGLQHVM